MRSPFVLAFSLSLALTPSIVVHAADRGPEFSQIPAGAQVRLTLEAGSATMSGTLLRAQSDSLFVTPRGGGSTLAVPISSLASLAFVDAERPSPRKATLLGIGLGAAGGALVGVVAGQATGDGAGGGLDDGGSERARFAPSAATATTPAQARATQDFRAVLGAVVGGLVGGCFGALGGFGMTEEHWEPVALPAAPSSWRPAPAAPAVFAIRVPLSF